MKVLGSRHIRKISFIFEVHPFLYVVLFWLQNVLFNHDHQNPKRFDFKEIQNIFNSGRRTLTMEPPEPQKRSPFNSENHSCAPLSIIRPLSPTLICCDIIKICIANIMKSDATNQIRYRNFSFDAFVNKQLNIFPSVAKV